MEATATMKMDPKRRLRMAADLLWFASASLAAGLAAAIVAALLVILLAQPAYARSVAPRFVAPAAEKPILMRSLDIKTEIAGTVARTTVEMTFYNPNRRVLEGELQFPLLDGQQVTGFALDIEGTLRDAVVVEKSRGQQVFEDITRRRVDPGLLQKTEGNNFKLRVYPIFPQRTRTVSVTYSENLPTHGVQATYRLPLDYGTRVGVFTLDFRVTGGSPLPKFSGPAARDLAFERGRTPDVLRTTKIDFEPKGELEATVTIAPGARIITQRVQGRDYFHAEVPVRPVKVKRSLPNAIGLIWDSSASGEARDHARELALLDAYFAAVRNAEVELVRIRDTVEPAQTYRIANGEWAELRRALETTIYDGATNLSAFVPNPRLKEYLLFSDGLANYGESAFARLEAPLYAIASSAQSNPAWLKTLAHRGAGRYLDLMAEKPDAAIEKLLFHFERVQSVHSNGAIHFEAAPYPANGVLTVSGVMTEPAANVRVRLAVPGRKPRTVSFRVVEDANRSALAASFWARERVAALEADPAPNRPEILRIARTFGLVTRETSLIVLETIQDYVRFEIEPPAELMAQYERMRGNTRAAQADPAMKIERVVAMLKDREAWWNREFSKGPLPPSRTHVYPSPTPWRSAPAQPERKDAYLTTTDGGIVSAPGAGVCMRSSQWSPALTLPQCDPDLVHKPAPRAIPPQPKMLARRPSPAPKPAMKASSPVSPGATSASSAAPLAVRAWDTNASYRARLATANAAEAYGVYLEERPAYRTSPAFYLDVADMLIAKGLQPLAMRVLSNLAEIDLENRHTLRSLAQRLVQLREHTLAIGIYRKIAEISPEEPQSFRDLGLAYAAAGENQRAIDALYEVVVRTWHVRFPEIEMVALTDLNAIVAASKGTLDVSRIDPRLIRNMPVDLRFVLTWDADNTNVDLQVTDPNGQVSYPGGGVSFQGGRLTQNLTGGYGPEEYAVRFAKPGAYRIVARYSGDTRQVVGAGPVYAHVHVYTQFGTGEQRVRTHNVLLTRVGMAPVVTMVNVPDAAEGE